MTSKVYYTDFRVKPGDNLLKKLKRLCLKAGIRDIDFDKDFDMWLKEEC